MPDPAVSPSADTKECPFCLETIKAGALRCHLCHADLTAVSAPPPASLPVPSPASMPLAPLSGERVSAPLASWQVLDLLAHLVDKNLVVYEEDENGKGRYRLLETVRQYARDRLHDSAEGEAIRERHQEWFLRMAEEVKPKLFGPERGRWFEYLEAEHDNLRAALDWCRAGRTGQAELEVRLTAALGRFWDTRGYLREGRAWQERALSRLSPAMPPLLREDILAQAAWMALLLRDFASARLCMEQWLDILREYARETGERHRLGKPLNILAVVAAEEGHHEEARSLYEEALTVFREQGDEGGVAMVLGNLGALALKQEDYDAARGYLEESLSLSLEQDQSDKRFNLGFLAYRQGRDTEALAQGRAGLRLLHQSGDRVNVPDALSLPALLAQRFGQMERAARLFGAVEGLCHTMGLPPVQYNTADSGVIATVRFALGEAAFAAAFAEGKAMTVEQAIAYALQENVP